MNTAAQNARTQDSCSRTKADSIAASSSDAVGRHGVESSTLPSWAPMT